MPNYKQFLDGKKILVYHIDARVPLRRSNDLEGTSISLISGNGVLNKVLKEIKEGKVEVLVTIGIPCETVKLIEVAIRKSQEDIALIEYVLKGNETRDGFLANLEAQLLSLEGGAAYRINHSAEPLLFLNPGEVERNS